MGFRRIGARALAATLLAVAAGASSAHGAPGPGPGADRAAPRIVNPDAAGGVPYQAGLVPTGSDGGVALPLHVFCGGTIRDATHVITAAHCVAGQGARDISVVAGVVSRATASGAQTRSVTGISAHPLYGVVAGHDLAILTLNAPLVLGPNVAALPVAAPGDADVGRRALVSGWGTSDPRAGAAGQPDELRWSAVDVYDPARCDDYGTVFAAGQMLCAGRTDGVVTTDACQGDSGGPLARVAATAGAAATPADADALLGIVSFGHGCGDPGYPGVYTRLSDSDNYARATAADPPARAEPTAAPVISGAASLGGTLSCSPGGWSDPRAQIAFRWLSGKLDAQGRPQDVRVDGSGPTLELTEAFAGRIVACIAQAGNAGGVREQQARPVGPIAAVGTSARTPLAAQGSSLVSLQRPTAAIAHRDCTGRRCRLTIVTTAAGRGATNARVTLQRIGSRRTTVIAAKRLTSRIFSVVTGRLARGRYRVMVTPANAGGLAGTPVSVVLTVGSR
jgi:hypothetical protein